MKIVFLSDDFPPTSFGGAGISTYELAKGMKEAGHDVYEITTCRKESDAGQTEYKGIKVFKIASDYHEKWRAYVSLHNRPVVREVRKLLKKIGPDVVHANNIHFYLSYYCLRLAKRYAKVVVFTARDTMSVCGGKLGTERYLNNFDYHTTWVDHVKHAKKRWNPLHNLYTRKYLGYADNLVAVSNSLREGLVQNGIKNVKTIHTGADLDFWQTNKHEISSLRKRYNLENKKVVLFGGRLSESKGGKKTIEAMSKITKEVPDAILLVLGAVDRFASSMKKLANELGIRDRLVFTGWIDRENISNAYALSDVVLVPSLYLDPFPRIVIEAMASAKPVIATCYGGAPEIVVDGVTGFVVNPLNPNEIAAKTLDFLKNPKKAEKFGQAGYERVKSDFNLDKVVEEYLTIYQSE